MEVALPEAIADRAAVELLEHRDQGRHGRGGVIVPAFRWRGQRSCHHRPTFPRTDGPGDPPIDVMPLTPSLLRLCVGRAILRLTGCGRGATECTWYALSWSIGTMSSRKPF